MKEQDIARINELYHKSKSTGLSSEEAEEQARLRREYIAAIKGSVRDTMKNVSIVESDGSVTDVGRIIESKEKRKN